MESPLRTSPGESDFLVQAHRVLPAHPEEAGRGVRT